MHLWPGLCPRPRWGSLQCSPRPASWIRGRGGRGGDEVGGERSEGRRRKGRGWETKGGGLSTNILI